MSIINITSLAVYWYNFKYDYMENANIKKTKIIITLALLLLIILVSALPTLYLPYFLKNAREEEIIEMYGDFDFVYNKNYEVTIDGVKLQGTRPLYVYQSNFIFEQLYVVIKFPVADKGNTVNVHWGEEWMEGGEIVEYTGN